MQGVDFGADMGSAALAAAVFFELIGKKIDFNLELKLVATVRTIVNGLFEGLAALNFFHG